MEDNKNNESAAEFDAGALTESLLREEPESQPEQQESESESAEDERVKALNDGLTTLFEDGWTEEELLAFSKDAKAREDIQKNGKTIRQAARAYEKRLRESTAEKGGKRGVPTVRSASGAGANGYDRIADMSDREFDEFFAKTMRDAMSGKKIRL